ncbi:hypothetical protein Tco_0349855 [Tanacetum coccineum]
MTTLKFVDTHNMVAFLSKPAESEGFEKIVDFLNANPINLLEQQVGKMSSHKIIYEALSHTKKIFGNMRRVGKGFSGRETPLFQTMLVQDQADMGEGSTIPTDPHHTPTITQPSSSQPQNKQRPKKPKRKDTEILSSSGYKK